MTEYRILFLGDVMGEPGRRAVQHALPSLKDTYKPLFTIINGENAAAGHGITPKIADELLAWGADGITLGNHALNKRDIYPYLESSDRIIRPANMSPGSPGRGLMTITQEGITLTVINMSGRVFMDPHDDPFRMIDTLLGPLPCLIDFHGEATSEKIAFGWHVDGRATAIVGTHTHVQTADEQILPEGTAYITDVGMSGPHNGVIGMDRSIVVRRFVTGMPAKFEVANGPGVVHGACIAVDAKTHLATDIERIRFAT
ncbi:MAG: TIGR00282 family metallophosphoesterase [Fimbriimonadaceae bacterium]|nr:TIGR00282 family metallophosphoesterase [Fimbriimonadaceae bacterium]